MAGNLYQACDAASGQCVAIAPPGIPNAFKGCSLSAGQVATALNGGAGPRVAVAAACPSGLCVVGKGISCTWQACTAACSGDHGCPPGSLCKKVPGPSPAPPAPVCLPPPGTALYCTKT